jgi:hypothetical protein
MVADVVRVVKPRSAGPIKLTVSGMAAIAMLAALAIGAFYGGWELMHPAADGSSMEMPLEYLRHSPFASYFIPGLLLFTVFGVGSVVAALAGVIRHWSALYLSFAIGVGQMIWITVELLMVQVFHPVLHPGLFCWGAAIAILAFFWWRKTLPRPAYSA